jgi:hypothetical protein
MTFAPTDPRAGASQRFLDSAVLLFCLAIKETKSANCRSHGINGRSDRRVRLNSPQPKRAARKQEPIVTALLCQLDTVPKIAFELLSSIRCNLAVSIHFRVAVIVPPDRCGAEIDADFLGCAPQNDRFAPSLRGKGSWNGKSR